MLFRHFFISCLALAALACQPEAPGPTPPNILFLFADDQTYEAVRALGNEEIYTPNLDRLARRGATFTHAYNMGGWNGAICVASRAMIISGRSIWRARDISGQWAVGEQLDQTWPRLMAGAGYDTYMTGKWHVQAPAAEIFRTSRHIRPGMPGDTPAGYHRPQGPGQDTWSPTDSSFGGFWAGGTHWSEVVRNDALDYLGMAAQRDRPFFMYLAFNAPHDPRQSPQRFVDMYPLEEVAVPASFLPQNPWMDPMGCPETLRDEALAPFPRTEYAVKVHRQEYYAIVSHMDEQIGLILDSLEATGKLDNTFIFFTADHGLSVGQHGLLGKQNMYDHSVRVPLMIAGPGVPAGKTISQDVYLQDLMATALDIAGIEAPDYLEFQSLLPLIEEKADAFALPAVYGAYTMRQRMVRKDGFKLIVYPEADKLLLYDLANDPEELTDLADDPAHRKDLERLWPELLALQAKFDDPLALDAVGPSYGLPSATQ